MIQTRLAQIAAGSLVLASVLALRAAVAQDATTQPADAAAAAPVPIFEPRSLLAMKFDLTKMEPVAFQLWLTELAQTADPKQPPEQIAEVQRQIDRQFGQVSQVRLDLIDSGAPVLYESVALGFGGPEMMLYAPIAEDAPSPDATAVASLISRGRKGQPTGPEPANAQPNEFIIKPFGNAVLGATGDNFRRLMAKAPAPALADVTSALSSSGSAVTIVSVPSAESRPLLQNLLSTVLTGPNQAADFVKDAKRILLAVDFPPQAHAKLSIETADGAADRVKDTLTGLIGMLSAPDGKVRLPGLKPESVQELLKSTVKGNRVEMDLDDAAVKKLAGPVFVGLISQGRATSMMVRSASNLRQILLGIVMYANEHQGAFPDTFTQLEKYGVKGPVLVNPRGGKASPDYVYAKPAVKMNGVKTPTTVIVYENPDDLPAGSTTINVGYADGHVEAIALKQFNDQIKPTLPATQPN